MKDKTIIKDLAKKAYEYAVSNETEERRNLWRDHNSLLRTRPLVIVNFNPPNVVPELNELLCEDELAREIELSLRCALYRMTLNDDTVHEPWYTIRAVFDYPETIDRRWGPKISVTRPEYEHGAFIFDPPLKTDNDFQKLVKPIHKINEQATRERYEKTCDLLDGALPVRIDRTPVYMNWYSDISTDVAYLRGLEQMMYDPYDNPGFFKRLAAFLSESALGIQDEAEAKGDFSTASHTNQAVTYARELPDPIADNTPVTRNLLWVFCASQETTVMSPAMWEEYILAYQKPIYEKYGLLAYGCCEDLTKRISILKRSLPNLRRIAVTPWADLRSCAEQISDDYVMSWRPSPTDMVASDFDPERVRRAAREAFKIAGENKNHIDVTLKDVHTVSGNMGAIPGFVKCVKEAIEEGDWA